MNHIHADRKRPIRKTELVKAAAFLLILVMLFQFFTIMYDRPISERLIDMRNQPENSLDAVAIGSSSVYRFYNPMEGWEKYGLTSYAYGIAGAVGENMIFSVKEVLKKQKPEVLILDGRGFMGSRTDLGLTTNFYRYLKNYPNQLFRWKIINHFNKLKGTHFSSDQLPFYLTLILNHENYWTIFRKASWKKAILGPEKVVEKNEYQNMGYAMAKAILPIDVIPYDPDIRQPMDETGEKALREVLEYCQDIGQKAIIVIAPFQYTKEDTADLNTMEDIAKEYGVPFLNACKDQEKIGLDWETDFYNKSHTNLLGATKYTNYILDFLMENYEFTDHRGDSDYANWEEEDKEYQKLRKVYVSALNKQLKEIGRTHLMH